MKQYGFGIDIGGTTVKLGFFTGEALTEKWEIPTRLENNGSLILPDVAEAILTYLEKHNIPKEEVYGLGMGVPGAVLPGGIVNRCVNTGWGVVDAGGEMERLTGLPTQVANDANVAALGESWKGGAAGCKNVVCVTLGTGVGGGIILDGKILAGVHGAGGEVGHIPMNRQETDRCGCGKRGCAEQYCSATGIVRTARKMLGESGEPSSLRALPKLTCKDVFDHAARGDKLALAITDRVYDDLGFLVAKICCVIDPEKVVIGGGVSKAGQVLLDGVQHYYEKYSFHASREIAFGLAELGNDAGIVGAVKLARDSAEKRN